MGSHKDEKFLAGKNLGGRPAVVEARVTRPVKPHKPKVLTPQEWKFVEEFCAGDGHVTLKEAAIRSGYSEVWSKNRARELTDPEVCPHIVAAIQERRRELGEKYGTTFERHMRDLQVIRDQALQAGAYGAAVHGLHSAQHRNRHRCSAPSIVCQSNIRGKSRRQCKDCAH
jgi:hypothetical protein